MDQIELLDLMTQLQILFSSQKNLQLQNAQQKKKQGGMSYQNGYNLYKNYSGGAGGGEGGGGIMDWFSSIGSESGAGGETAGGGWGVPAAIAAAIVGQHMMSGKTDRRVDDNGKLNRSSGHRTGDVFSGDFLTEPWMAWGEQQLGVGSPTAGEKTDAAIDRLQGGKGGFSDVASTIPATGYQWFDPVGNFFDDIMSDKFGKKGKIASLALLPQTGLKRVADWIGKLF